MLPEHFAILGAARTGYTDEEFRAEQRKHILEARGNKETNSAELDKFLRILFYLAFDSTNSAEYVKLKDRVHSLQQQENIPDRIIYYLATPPLMYELVPKYLQENGKRSAITDEKLVMSIFANRMEKGSLAQAGLTQEQIERLRTFYVAHAFE